MATPKSLFPVVKDFEEDWDTTGHLEIDATPPIAAKKIRKRTGSRKNNNSSSVDPFESNVENPSVPKKNVMITIEEDDENEKSPLRSKNVSANRLTEVAKDILSGFSPLTRSGKKEHDETKKSKTRTTPTPFEIRDYGFENQVPGPGTRRSSRLRGKQKHSMV